MQLWGSLRHASHHITSRYMHPVMEVTGMTRPGKRSKGKAGIEPRSSALEADAPPLGQRGGPFGEGPVLWWTPVVPATVVFSVQQYVLKFTEENNSKRVKHVKIHRLCLAQCLAERERERGGRDQASVFSELYL